MEVRSAVAAATIAGMALVLSACGGSSTSAPTESAAADLGVAAAAAAGAPVEVPTLTIGYVKYVGANFEAAREEVASKQAAEALGWTFISCDGKGVPATMAKCAKDLVNQNVDVLMTNAFPQSYFTEALDIAEKKGIPVISVGGDPGPQDRLDGAYYPDESAMGGVLADWMVEKLGADSAAKIIVQNFPAQFIVARNEAMLAKIAETTITVGGEFDVDPANLIAGTKDQITSFLNSTPDAKAFWIPFSSSDAGAAQAIEAKFPGKTFPDRPLLLGVYASLPTLDLIRQGKLDASVENALGWASWVAMDQIAQNAARGTTIAKTTPSYGADLDWTKPTVVTKDNLPPEGELLAPPTDYVSFFTSKWNNEFTNLD